jgi:hypothetical protein
MPVLQRDAKQHRCHFDGGLNRGLKQTDKEGLLQGLFPGAARPLDIPRSIAEDRSNR